MTPKKVKKGAAGGVIYLAGPKEKNSVLSE